MAADTREPERERVQNTGRLRVREENEARRRATDNSLFHTQHWSQPILFVALLSLFIFECFYIMLFIKLCVMGKCPNTAVMRGQELLL